MTSLGVARQQSPQNPPKLLHASDDLDVGINETVRGDLVAVLAGARSW